MIVCFLCTVCMYMYTYMIAHIKPVLPFCGCYASCVVWLEGHLVFGGESGDVHVWKADTLKEITRHKAHSGWWASRKCIYSTSERRFDTVFFSLCTPCRHCNLSSSVYRRLCASFRQQRQVCRCMASYITCGHRSRVLRHRITVSFL